MVVLEWAWAAAGFDAVNADRRRHALLTSIDLDHCAILDDRDSIGREKAHIMRAGRPAVVADPDPPAGVPAHAAAIGADPAARRARFQLRRRPTWWWWRGRQRLRLQSGASGAARRQSLLNASGVLAVFEALAPRLPISAQAVRQGTAGVDRRRARFRNGAGAAGAGARRRAQPAGGSGAGSKPRTR
ncbi:MAG: hypothetical protein U1E95_06675 [Rubrivivax sp.]